MNIISNLTKKNDEIIKKFQEKSANAAKLQNDLDTTNLKMKQFQDK